MNGAALFDLVPGWWILGHDLAGVDLVVLLRGGVGFEPGVLDEELGVVLRLADVVAHRYQRAAPAVAGELLGQQEAQPGHYGQQGDQGQHERRRRAPGGGGDRPARAHRATVGPGG